MTMTLVSTVTVGAGGAASIEFTSIPQTGTDLVVMISGRQSAVGQINIARFNNDSAGNYNTRYLEGTGSAASSGLQTASTQIFAGSLPNSSSTTNTFGNASFYVSNYSTNQAKSVSIDSVHENNATAAKQHLLASNWTGTTAITRITFLADFAQYSTASLYTITKGSGGATVS